MHPAAIGSPYLAKRMRYYENFVLPVLKTVVKANGKADVKRRTTIRRASVARERVRESRRRRAATKGNCTRATSLSGVLPVAPGIVVIFWFAGTRGRGGQTGGIIKVSRNENRPRWSRINASTAVNTGRGDVDQRRRVVNCRSWESGLGSAVYENLRHPGVL